MKQSEYECKKQQIKQLTNAKNFVCCIGFSKFVCTYLQSNIKLPDLINFVKCKYFDYSINDMGIFFLCTQL